MSIQKTIQRHAKGIAETDRYANEVWQITDRLNEIQTEEDQFLDAPEALRGEQAQEAILQLDRRIHRLAEDGLQQEGDREAFRNAWRVLHAVVLRDLKNVEFDKEKHPHHAVARNLKADVEMLMGLMAIDIPEVYGQGGPSEGRGRG